METQGQEQENEAQREELWKDAALIAERLRQRFALAESHAELIAAFTTVLQQTMSKGGPTGFVGLVSIDAAEGARTALSKARALVPAED